MLHLVHTRSGLAKCKELVENGDDVVFIGDGVICAEEIADCQVFIQFDDAERCGVATREIGEPCGMADLVELVAKHDQSVSWR